MKQNALLISLSFVLLIIAFATRHLFLSLAIDYITGENISFVKSWTLPHQTFPFLLFLLAFGILPFLYLLVKKRCELTSLSRKLTSIALIIFFGVTLLLSRIVYMRFKAAQIHDLLQRAEFADDAEIPTIKLEQLNLEVFLIIGFGLGTLLALLIFRRATK